MGTPRHGMARTPTYQAWKDMKRRCYNPSYAHFDRYGGRGITVCDRWRDSFEAFLADMGERPFPGAQLDRENNDGNYELGNCKWSTALANSNNRACSPKIEFKGEALTASEWAHKLGLQRSAIAQRLRNGWSVERALTTPMAKTGRYASHPQPTK